MSTLPDTVLCLKLLEELETPGERGKLLWMRLVNDCLVMLRGCKEPDGELVAELILMLPYLEDKDEPAKLWTRRITALMIDEHFQDLRYFSSNRGELAQMFARSLKSCDVKADNQTSQSTMLMQLRHQDSELGIELKGQLELELLCTINDPKVAHILLDSYFALLPLEERKKKLEDYLASSSSWKRTLRAPLALVASSKESSVRIAGKKRKAEDPSRGCNQSKKATVVKDRFVDDDEVSDSD